MMPGGSVSSKRRPWPADIVLGSSPLMLKQREDGLLVGRKTEGFERVVPTSYEYSSLPIFLERTYVVRRVSGVGLRVQQAADQERQLRICHNVDTSINGLIFAGPKVTTVTPPTTGPIRQFVESLRGPLTVLYTLAGQYVLYRAGDTALDWTVSKDFGASRIAQDAVRFKGSYVTPRDEMYVALDNYELWRFDASGPTWAQCATTATIKAQHLAKLNDELWKAYDNKVSKATGDPALAASWSGDIICGDGSTNITSIAASAGQLWVFNDDGSIGTVATDGTYGELFPRVTTGDSTNGRGASQWLNSLWARHGDGLVRLDDPGSMTPAGPELLLDNDTEVRGKAISFTGHQTWQGYLATYNVSGPRSSSVGGSGSSDPVPFPEGGGSDAPQPAGIYSHIWKFGSWQNLEGDETASGRFLPEWHGSIADFYGKQITTVAVISAGTMGSNERLFIGFQDGDVAWFILPSGSPSPLTDGNCSFTTAAKSFQLPLHHAILQADTKAWHGFSVFGPVLTPTNYAQIQYRTDLGSSLTALGTNFTVSGQRGDSPDGLSSKAIDVWGVLVNSDAASTPVLEGLAIHEQILPALKLTYEATVEARNYQALHNGSVSRLTAEQQRTAVKDAASATGFVTLLLPDEDSKSVSVIDYGEVLVPGRFGRSWDIPFKAVEFKTNATYGTIGRLFPYTIGDLGGFTISQLGAL